MTEDKPRPYKYDLSGLDDKEPNLLASVRNMASKTWAQYIGAGFIFTMVVFSFLCNKSDIADSATDSLGPSFPQNNSHPVKDTIPKGDTVFHLRST